ncbi:MAG TPA: hypothetical protein P5204_01290 [Kiritimatiellia bacterium]|nr:hypothetical protein [Kiritimatiellia bacterium]
MKRTWIVWGLAAGVAVAGCGKKAEEKLSEKLTEKLLEKSMAKDGVKAKVDISGNTMSFTTTDADGKQSNVKMDGDSLVVEGPDGVQTFRAGGAGVMPKDFPADVYVMSGASVVSSISTPGGANLTLKSASPKADVVAKYAAEMKAQGWTTETTMDMGETAMISFAKDNRQASVIVQAEEGATAINLTVGTK